MRLRLRMGRATASESTFRRVLQRVDADELDTAVSGWLARRVAGAPGDDHADGTPTSSGSGRAIALDGKTARGARRADGRAVHLLDALDHASGVVLGQTESMRRPTSYSAAVAASGSAEDFVVSGRVDTV